MSFHSLFKTGYNIHTQSVIFNKVLLLRAGEGNENFQSTKRENALKKVGNSVLLHQSLTIIKSQLL